MLGAGNIISIAPLDTLYQLCAETADPRSQTVPFSTISVGHAFIQNVRRGHSELATDIDPRQRLATALAELALAN